MEDLMEEMNQLRQDVEENTAFLEHEERLAILASWITSVTWICMAFLCLLNVYILLLFRSPRQTKPIDKGTGVLLVTAHPDDEVMFFGPAILQFLVQGNPVSLLCMSSGDFDGLGNVRKDELMASCATLGIDKSHITIIDHSELQDGPNQEWEVALLAKIIADECDKRQCKTIVTFDANGVSGHPNHCALFHGARRSLITNLKGRDVTLLCLESTNLLRKYIGILDTPLSYLSGFVARTASKGRSLLRDAMHCHQSQLVWYRRLFIFFSRYVYVNTFRHVEAPYAPNSKIE